MPGIKKISAPHLSLNLGVILIGWSPILIKLAHAPGIVTTFYRFIIGTSILLPIFLVARYRVKTKLPLKGILLSLAAGFCLATDMAFWTTGIVASNATLPTLVGNLAPVWVGIGALFIFKEKQSIGFWLGLLLSIGGMVLLLSDGSDQAEAGNKGILFGFVAGIFYSGYLLIAQTSRKLVDTISFLFITSVSTACFAFLYLIVFGYSFTGYDTYTWTLWIVMGLVLQVGAWFLINYSQGFLPASIVSPTLLGQPIVTGIIATALLKERFVPLQLLGALIIISGIYIVHFSRQNKPG